MKKTFVLFSILTFGLMFSQLSEISKIDKEVWNRYSEISKKYKKKHPPERLSEEAEVENYRNESYKKAIENIQKNEVKVDWKTIETNSTKEAEYETGINGFRKLFSEKFDSTVLDDTTGTYKSEIQFLIDENGIPSNVESTGNSNTFNQEAIITFYAIINKGKWKPAEKDGVPIKSIFRLPLTIQFK